MSTSDLSDEGLDSPVAELPLMRELPPDVAQLVIACLVPESFTFGQVVVQEGDPADAFFVVRSGRARVIKAGLGGQEVPLAILQGGDSFGEIGLLEGGTRSATVRASSALRVLRLDGSVLSGLVARHPGLRERLELRARRLGMRTLLEEASPFSALPQPALNDLLNRLEPTEHRAGEVIFEEGGAPGAMFVVREGRLRATRRDQSGRERDLSFYRRGDLFGEASLFSGDPRHASVAAVTDCHLLRLDPDAFHELLAVHAAFRERISAQVTEYDPDRTVSVPLDFADDVVNVDEIEIDTQPVRSSRPEPVPVAAAGESPGDLPPTPPGGRGSRRRIRRIPQQWQIDETDCGAACFAMVSRHHGQPLSLARARDAVQTTVDGTSLHGMARGAQRLGLPARPMKISARNLDSLPLPAIVHWEGDHWVVLHDVTPTHVRYADPALGPRRIRRAEFLERWTGYAVVITTAADTTPTAAATRAPKWLRQFFWPHRGSLLAAVLLALLVSAAQISLPVFIQLVVDEVLPQRDTELLTVLLLGIAALLVAMTIGSFVQRWLLARAAVRIDAASLDFVAGKLLALPMRYFYTRRSGDIQRRLAGLRLVREFAVQNGVVALTATAQLVTAVVLMFFYSWQLALVFLGLAPLYGVLLQVARTRLRPAFDAEEEAFGRYSSRQIDAIKGIEAVKAMGAEDGLRAEMLQDFKGVSRFVFRADLASLYYEASIQALSFATMGLFLWAGSEQVLAGNLSLGGFVAFNVLLALASPSLVDLLSLWDQQQYNKILMDRLNDVFEQEPEQGSRRDDLRPVRSLSGQVRLDRVGFSFTPDSPPILSDISLDVAPGTTVAIVGRSGSGKTTLAKCLAGLVEPSTGSIRYDGVDMTTLDYRSLRRRIGFVLQESFLFSDTIAANIAFGDPSPDHEQVVRAARAADAAGFIEHLPLGYSTRVGETGLLLSGGQRQRVAIARAIYPNPPVLILDEATSSLDTESENVVRKNIARLLTGRTSFVIAHRLSTIRGADSIVVLDGGRLVEQGTHEELIDRRGLYYHLISQQLDS